jgi:hypothetical protein
MKASSRYIRVSHVPVLVALLTMAAVVVGCGDDSSTPTSPTSASTTPAPVTTSPPPAPAPAPPPAPTTVSLAGNVRSVSGLRLGGATVTVLDGANSGRTATADGNGAYRIAEMQSANGNLVARAGGFFEDRRGIFVDGTSTLDFMLRANFSGRWAGQVRSTGCSDDGVLDGFCNEFPSLSTDLVLELSQTDSGVSGTIRLAAAPTIKASGNASGDQFTLSGRGEFVQGVEMSFEDWNTALANPTRLGGTFSWRLFPSANGVRGGAKWTFSVAEITRSAAAASRSTASARAEDGRLQRWVTNAMRQR